VKPKEHVFPFDVALAGRKMQILFAEIIRSMDMENIFGESFQKRMPVLEYVAVARVKTKSYPLALQTRQNAGSLFRIGKQIMGKGILKKIHVVNRTQAAIWAVQHGIVAELASE